MMEFVLNVLLSYVTLAAAGVSFALILAVLLIKKGSLTPRDKRVLLVLLGVLALYFVFVFAVSAGLGAPRGRAASHGAVTARRRKTTSQCAAKKEKPKQAFLFLPSWRNATRAAI